MPAFCLKLGVPLRSAPGQATTGFALPRSITGLKLLFNPATLRAFRILNAGSDPERDKTCEASFESLGEVDAAVEENVNSYINACIPVGDVGHEKPKSVRSFPLFVLVALPQ